MRCGVPTASDRNEKKHSDWSGLYSPSSPREWDNTTGALDERTEENAYYKQLEKAKGLFDEVQRRLPSGEGSSARWLISYPLRFGNPCGTCLDMDSSLQNLTELAPFLVFKKNHVMALKLFPTISRLSSDKWASWAASVVMLLLQPVFTDAVPQATWDAVEVFQIIAMEASGACCELRFSREEMTSFSAGAKARCRSAIMSELEKHDSTIVNLAKIDRMAFERWMAEFVRLNQEKKLKTYVYNSLSGLEDDDEDVGIAWSESLKGYRRALLNFLAPPRRQQLASRLSGDAP